MSKFKREDFETLDQLIVAELTFENEQLKEKLASSDHFFGLISDERDRLKAEVAEYEKLFAERGYAFQESVNKDLQNRDTWKAKAEKLV